MEHDSINRKWLKYLDTNVIDIYPIQFANCDRLQKNDAVYIFDEVGSGKTISSGLMALDYLCNNEGEVLVITTNALAKKGQNSEYGQFLDDWYRKLPFEALNLTKRIDVINNYYSNLSQCCKYGLVIVDEAQLFLNEESKRYKNLINIEAEKIVFLTATPIKGSETDLYKYINIAKCVTRKELPDDWVEKINTNNKEPKDLVCSMFDVCFPVTRYFKDTIMSLNVDGYEKKQARRLMPKLWEYESKENKDEVLLKKIDEEYRNNADSRFVVFTRFVDAEAKKIGGLLNKAGFRLYEYGQDIKGVKTYKVVTGENAGELSCFTGIGDNLPTVLILTYQIAEQGVNLPGYNHVVNYHVSAFPSALEQRFGRIDRMGKNGSQFEEINMCFLISRRCFDTNTWNFYCAISTYLWNLISYLPSKNTVLSEDIIQYYGKAKDLVKDYVNRITDLLDQPEQIESIIKYFSDRSCGGDESSIKCDCDKDLFEFIDEKGIEYNIQMGKEEAIDCFINDVLDALKEYKSESKNSEQFSTEEYIEVVKKVSDKIFYSKELKTVDAIEGCGKTISDQEGYKEYSEKFKEQVKLPIIIGNYLVRINGFFEQKFINNDFNSLFPYGGYKHVFEEIFEKENISDGDKKLIISNCDDIVKILPVFKMFEVYGNKLQAEAYTTATIYDKRWDENYNTIRERFDGGTTPFVSAFRSLCRMVRSDAGHIGISDKLFNKYFAFSDEFDDRVSKDYYQFVCDDNEIVQASNWFKLAYHYTRREAACFMNRKCLCRERNTNYYKYKEELIHKLAAHYEEYLNNPEVFFEKYQKTVSALHNTMKKIAENEYYYYNDFEKQRWNNQSLFNFFIYTDQGNLRKCYKEEPLGIIPPYCKTFFIKDLWTQGIIYDCYGFQFKGVSLTSVAKLPEEEFAKYPLYPGIRSRK